MNYSLRDGERKSLKVTRGKAQMQPRTCCLEEFVGSERDGVEGEREGKEGDRDRDTEIFL